MNSRGAPVSLLRRSFPQVGLTGRCFLLRPQAPSSALLNRKGTTSALVQDVECVEMTQETSLTETRRSGMPGSLLGNSYYTQRYTHASSTPQPRLSREHAASFSSGDVVLRLWPSAVPRELAHKRIVDVTGLQTSYLNTSEHRQTALATVEEALETMHLHDGHEVPAVQRGDVDLVRLQPFCVYSPPPSHQTKRGVEATWRDKPAPLCLADLPAALHPLSNPGVLLGQNRRLSFRSDMEALQVARVMASRLGALKGGVAGGSSASCSGARLKPIVRDGHLVGMTIRLPRC